MGKINQTPTGNYNFINKTLSDKLDCQYKLSDFIGSVNC